MRRRGAILVFDNDHSIAELITLVLGEEGYVVQAFRDDAPAGTASMTQPHGLILLDLALPARTVAAVRAYARSYYPSDVPVVITTMCLSFADADGVRGSDCLMKPFALDDLLACVARYVHLPISGIQPPTVNSSGTADRQTLARFTRLYG